jgi:hypothetical protein
MTTKGKQQLKTNVAALKLETNATALDLEMEIDVSQDISKQERYSAN